MKRTTIILPERLAILVDRERRRLDVSTAHLIRRALEVYFDLDGANSKALPFIGIGASGSHDTARRIDEMLSQEWGPARNPALTL